MMYIMYTTVAVTAIGGNGIVCYLVLAYQKMRTVTNYFIVNLAIGDILMASLCIPFGFVSNLLLQVSSSYFLMQLTTHMSLHICVMCATSLHFT